MKNLLLILSDFLIDKSKSYRWVVVILMTKLRTLSIIATVIVASLIFLSSGLAMVQSDIVRTLDSQSLAMTSTMVLGLGVIVISLTTICLSFRRRVWGLAATPRPQNRVDAGPPAEFSPLVQALTLLVLDHVEERKEQRLRQSARHEQMQQEHLNA